MSCPSNKTLANIIFKNAIISVLGDFAINNYPQIQNLTYACQTQSNSIISRGEISLLRAVALEGQSVSANVGFDLLSQILSSNTSLVNGNAKKLTDGLNQAISSGQLTNSLLIYAQKYNAFQFFSVNASKPTQLGPILIINTRTSRPTSQPVAVPEVLSTSNIAVIAAVGGFVIVAAVAIAVFLTFCRELEELPSSKGNVNPDDMVLQFDDNYPNKDKVEAELTLSTESRRILQRLYDPKRGNRNNVVVRADEIIRNDTFNSTTVFINKNRELYVDKRLGKNKEWQPLSELTVQEVSKLLSKIDMESFVDNFRAFGINGQVLVEIESLEDLRECEIPMPAAVARAFVDYLAELRADGVDKSFIV